MRDEADGKLDVAIKQDRYAVCTVPEYRSSVTIVTSYAQINM